MPRPRSPRAAALCAAVLLTGCASYPARTQGAFTDFQSGRLLDAVSSYRDTDVTRSAFLSGVEGGTVALAAGDWVGAKELFATAADVTRELDRRALVSLTDTAETLESWALNDTSREYFGEGFERVYLHASLALAYLGLGLLEDVAVETRLANRILEHEEELYETEYAAGGFGHFLSALAYELQGRLDEAYIDYRRMEAKGVGGELVGRALVRLATGLGYEDALGPLVETYGPDYERAPDSASIVVLAGVGLGPRKREAALAVPTDDGFLSLAVPGYYDAENPVEGLELQIGSQRVRTVAVEDVTRVARENLEDRLAWMATKSVARGLLKLGFTRKLESDHGAVGALVGNLYSLISERADLRAWQTLPHQWHAARAFLAPGVHRLGLGALGGDEVELGTFELEPGETMIVIARSVGRTLYAYPIGGLELDDLAESLQREAADLVPQP